MLFKFTYYIYLGAFLFFIFFLILVFQDRVSSTGLSGNSSVEQVDLELRNLFASATQVLGLKAHRAFLLQLWSTWLSTDFAVLTLRPLNRGCELAQVRLYVDVDKTLRVIHCISKDKIKM